MERIPTMDYATPAGAVRFNRRTLFAITAVIVASLAVVGSLLMGPELMFSNRGFPVTNERGPVRALVHDPSSRAEFRAYSIRSFGGFHVVDWREWHRDGRYLLIPKWAVVVLTSGVLLSTIVLARRAAAR